MRTREAQTSLREVLPPIALSLQFHAGWPIGHFVGARAAAGATGNVGATRRSEEQPYQMLCKTQPAGAPDAGICIPDAVGRF